MSKELKDVTLQDLVGISPSAPDVAFMRVGDIPDDYEFRVSPVENWRDPIEQEDILEGSIVEVRKIVQGEVSITLPRKIVREAVSTEFEEADWNALLTAFKEALE